MLSLVKQVLCQENDGNISMVTVFCEQVGYILINLGHEII